MAREETRRLFGVDEAGGTPEELRRARRAAARQRAIARWVDSRRGFLAHPETCERQRLLWFAGHQGVEFPATAAEGSRQD